MRGGVEAELFEDGGQVGAGDGVGGGGVEDFEGFAHCAEEGGRDVRVVACVGEGGEGGFAGGGGGLVGGGVGRADGG